jgi:hypothetical protein
MYFESKMTCQHRVRSLFERPMKLFARLNYYAQPLDMLPPNLVGKSGGRFILGNELAGSKILRSVGAKCY